MVLECLCIALCSTLFGANFGNVVAAGVSFVTQPTVVHVLQWIAIGTSFVLLGLAFGAIKLAKVLNYWKGEGLKMESDKNYRSPQPTFWRRQVRRLAGVLAGFWFLGRVYRVGKLPKKVKVKENGKVRYKARYVFVCNHQTEADAIMVAKLLGLRKVRYFIAFNQARGIRARFVAYTGGIPVDFFNEVGSTAPPVNGSQPNRPSVLRRLLEAVQAAIALLKAEPDSDFFIFPQGKLVADNDLKLAEFHDGAIRIGRALEEDGPVYFVAVGVHYDHDPKDRTFCAKVLNFFGIKSFAKFYGTINARTGIAVGEPILSTDLPKDKKQATAVLFGQIKDLVGEAAAACGCKLAAPKPAEATAAEGGASQAVPAGTSQPAADAGKVAPKTEQEAPAPAPAPASVPNAPNA